MDEGTWMSGSGSLTSPSGSTGPEGVTMEKLNKIYVKNLEKGIQVDMRFDVKASLSQLPLQHLLVPIRQEHVQGADVVIK